MNELKQDHEPRVDDLAPSDGWLRTAAAMAAEGFLLHDNTGAILACNPGAVRILGVPEEELCSRSLRQVFCRCTHEDGTPFPGDLHPAMEALHTARPVNGVIMGLSRRGDKIAWISVSAQPLFHADARAPHAVVSTFTDITDRKQTEERLCRSEERFRHMVENLLAAAVYVEGDRVRINKAVEEITGYSRGELGTLDKWFRKLFGEAHELVRAWYEEDRRIDFPQARTLTLTRKNGETRLVEFVGYVFKPGPGEVWLLHDVTERAAAEQRFRALFECSSDACLLLDHTAVIDCNTAALARLNCSDRTELLGRRLADLAPPHQPEGSDSAEKAARMQELAQQQGCQRFEWQARGTEGVDFPVDVSLTPITLRGRDALLMVWHDLSDRQNRDR